MSGRGRLAHEVVAVQSQSLVECLAVAVTYRGHDPPVYIDVVPQEVIGAADKDRPHEAGVDQRHEGLVHVGEYGESRRPGQRPVQAQVGREVAPPRRWRDASRRAPQSMSRMSSGPARSRAILVSRSSRWERASNSSDGSRPVSENHRSSLPSRACGAGRRRTPAARYGPRPAHGRAGSAVPASCPPPRPCPPGRSSAHPRDRAHPPRPVRPPRPVAPGRSGSTRLAPASCSPGARTGRSTTGAGRRSAVWPLGRVDVEGMAAQLVSPIPVTLCHGEPADGTVVLAAAQNEFFAELVGPGGGQLFGLGAVTAAWGSGSTWGCRARPLPRRQPCSSAGSGGPGCGCASPTPAGHCRR